MDRLKIVSLMFIAMLGATGCQRNKDQSASLSLGFSNTSVPASGSVNVVCAGQSNAIGVPAPAYQAVNGVTMEGGTLSGPCFVFAVEMMKAENVPVNVIQCAVDGSAISRWTNGGDLLNTCKTRAGTRNVKAVLFVQGEHEAQLVQPYPWGQAFNSFVASWSNIPVIFVQLGDITNFNVPNLSHIQTEQALSQGSNAFMVVSGALPTLDGIHRTPDANVTIGERMYSTFRTRAD
jgi:hypothetical protein